ncbi:MAG TPA: family 78 glycoside hydrolase catalytic domain [Dongiaceae bacterium]|nr:family 78 glycoside hydrolase catalytic domain [Dongiaceae bacterium]
MNVRNVKLALVLALVNSFAVAAFAGTDFKVDQLRCEYRENPVGIDVTQPRLSWILESDRRGQIQTAYEIVVASTPEQLAQDQGDLWDSGKVNSDQSTLVAYAGKTLDSRMPCYWKVRAWDREGQPSAWSAPALWSMGLLHPEDWQGKWIGWDQGERTNDFGGAQWIWFPEGNPAQSAPVATRYFRRVFELPASLGKQSAIMTITADDQFELYVNGQLAGKGDGWGSPQQFDVASLLRPGTNLLAVVARNVGSNPNPAGLLAKLKIESGQMTPLTIDTDGNWSSATNVPTGWNELAFDDSKWTPVMKLGEYGTQTWGIIRSDDRPLPARYLRREFPVARKIRRATAYICGLGLSELYLNGHKVGDDALSPAIASYDTRAFYLTYDVTAQLRNGTNAIGVILGNGRYYAPRVRVPAECRTFGYPKLRLQLDLEYADGTSAQIVSDENWKVTDGGPIRANNEFDGEVYDARMEMPGWNEAGFDEFKWSPVQVVSPGAPVLSAQISEPMRVRETIRPVAVTNPKPGVYIFDLGQNIAGWCRLKVSGAAGTVVKLRHGEGVNPDGTLYTANMRSAKAEDEYTLKGSGVEVYEPRFTHHGFRFVEVTGFPGEPGLDAIEGRVVHDALPPTGGFTTSNPLINKLHSNIYWGIRDNYRTLPTDMPRDERQGWMGDRQEVSKGETFLFNVAPLYSQWLTDIRDSQRADGSVPDVCPPFWPLYQDGVVWASTYVIVPHMLYDQYGDVRILEQHYDPLKEWVDYMAKFLKDDLMPRNTYADWCFPPRLESEMTVINSTDPKLTTDGNMMSSAIFYHDLQLMAGTARLLGKVADAERFEALAKKINIAFNRRYYNSERGYYDNGTQTSCILPLAFGMVPEDCKAKVFAQLVKSITVENDNHLRTGLVGGHYLMRVLSDNGRPDLAYTLATQTTYPSWGYMISKGATTVWELWNGDTADAGMNSRNIVMLIGDLNIWLHEYLGGIRPAEPGFKKIIIKPEMVGDLTWVQSYFDSPHGRIVSNWKREGDRVIMNIVIPANTTATVYVPAQNAAAVTEGGQPIAEGNGIKLVRAADGVAVYEVGAGSYEFKSDR